MQIAKMFASLGFKVDTDGLDDFKKGLQEVKKELGSVSADTKTAADALGKLKDNAKKFKEEMRKAGTSAGKIQGVNSGTKTSTTIKNLNDELDKITNSRKGVTKAIGKINASVAAGSPIWDRYRESVVRARRALHNINGEVKNLRANATVRVSGGIGSGGGGSGRGGGRGGGFGAAIGAGLGAGGIAGFLRGGFIPATALASTVTAFGYATKQVIETGREQTKMESMLQMTSKNTNEFARTLQYVNSEALRLGLSSTELGKSFAQINMSAQGLSQNQKEEMFTGFSEFMMSMGTSQDDQKGIFRAFNQMFSSNRILQEEINQLSERGIPATLVQDAAMKAYGLNSRSQVKKLQADGQLDPNKVLPLMAKMVQQMAHDTGAYDKMMNSSIVKQGQFMESLRQLSKQIADSGVDEAIGKMFGEMTKLVGVVSELVTGMQGAIEIFREMKSTLDSLTGGNSLFVIILGILFFRLGSIVKAVRAVVAAFGAKKGIMKSLGGLMTGTFGKAIGTIIKRFFVWTAVIAAVFKGLRYLNKEMKRRDDGELTIFDKMVWTLKEVDVWLRLVSLRIQQAWTKFSYFAKDFGTIKLPNGRVGIFSGYTPDVPWHEGTPMIKPRKDPPKNPNRKFDGINLDFGVGNRNETGSSNKVPKTEVYVNYSYPLQPDVTTMTTA